MFNLRFKFLLKLLPCDFVLPEKIISIVKDIKADETTFGKKNIKSVIISLSFICHAKNSLSSFCVNNLLRVWFIT